MRLIVITDVELAEPRSLAHVVRAALDAGAPAIQLRDKSLPARELFELGQVLRAMTHEAGALFFVNDRVDVALALGADGVHVGPDDLPVQAVRDSTPSGFLIGASTDDPRVAGRLVDEGADYIGCGAVYSTSTKADAGDPIGVDGLRRVVEAVSVPVIGIGGITVARAGDIAATGAAGIAVVGSVMSASDIGAAVQSLLAPW